METRQMKKNYQEGGSIDMRTRLRSKMMLLFMTCAVLLAVPAMALASEVNVNSVIDVTTPNGAVTLQPGQSENITINMEVRGNQDGTGTFEVYRDWQLQANGTFVGSNPKEFTVGPQDGGTVTPFSTTGTVSVPNGVPAGGPHTLKVGAFDITNTNTTGAKLSDGTDATYSVTVVAPPPPSDTTAPIIGYTLNPESPDGANGWYKSDVTLTWNVTDPESSVSKTGCVDQNITSDQDATEYKCSATSAGGNSGPESVTIKRDGSAPNAPNATTDPLNPVANSGGFFKDSVKVTYGGSADVGPSGIADYTTDQTFSTTGTHDYSGTATDNAGNVSTATTGQVKVDADAPKVGFTGCPTSVLLHSTQNVTVAASDVGSGLVSDPSGQIALDTNSVGPQSKTITVEDKVGHTTKSETCNYNVNYNFGGFLQPINDTAHDLSGNPNVSTFKAGSTVPVKFKLTDANGNTVQAGSAQWITPQKLTATSQAVDEATYSDPATAGNLYKWDSTAQQSIYNWSTKGLPSGFYYKIGVKLDDGQTYYTYISLR
jgi:hypothetical protein